LVRWLVCAVDGGWWLTRGGSSGVGRLLLVLGCVTLCLRITSNLLSVALGLPGSGGTGSGVTRFAMGRPKFAQSFIFALQRS